MPEILQLVFCQALQLELAQAQARAAHAEAKAEAGSRMSRGRMALRSKAFDHSDMQVLSELQESFQRNVPEMVLSPQEERYRRYGI